MAKPETAVNRITVHPDPCGGRPCIRGRRIRVKDVLDMRANELTPQQVLHGSPMAPVTRLRSRRTFRPFKGLAMAVLVAAFMGFASLLASEAQGREGSALASEAAALRKELAKLQQELETLRAENAALQRENESLRRMLSTRNADQPANASRTNSVRQPGSPRPASPATGSRSNAVPTTLQRPAAPSQSTAYWLSTWSGLRHNNGCRYYRNSTGKPCGANDGKACKLCGG